MAGRTSHDMLGKLTKLEGLVQPLTARIEAAETDLEIAKRTR